MCISGLHASSTISISDSSGEELVPFWPVTRVPINNHAASFAGGTCLGSLLAMNLYSNGADLAISSPCGVKALFMQYLTVVFFLITLISRRSRQRCWYFLFWWLVLWWSCLPYVAGVFLACGIGHTDQLDTCYLAEQFTHRGASINYFQKVSSWSWLVRRKCKSGMMETPEKRN